MDNIFDLTASPYFRPTNRPPARQEWASTAESTLGKAAEVYWRARSELSKPTVELAEHRHRKNDLWKLYREGPSYRIRNGSAQFLSSIGESAQLRPGPYGGDVA